ncbi:MAG: hypothetical protein O7D91_13870 [Planctomycetota bacterium]|nr:hypothetical protein [Planctomycetota bacterium]
MAVPTARYSVSRIDVAIRTIPCPRERLSRLLRDLGESDDHLMFHDVLTLARLGDLQELEPANKDNSHTLKSP